MKYLVLAAGVCFATSLPAEVLKLTPADPQPESLSPGLAVSYAYPKDVKTLEQAAKAAKSAEPGAPLAGLDHPDNTDGDMTLTSTKAYKVVAQINGYVQFEEPGTYTIEFVSNDGVQAHIGGQEVVFFDGRHPCEPGEPVQAEVPVAGWYDIDVLYFQRKGSACLSMLAGIGEPDWMPNEAFGH